MKKQHFLFGIASALMLAACDPVEVKESSLPVSSSGIESSTPIVISSEEPVDSAKLLSDFVTNLTNKKQTMTFDLGNGEYKATFVGDGGMSVSFGDVRTFGFVKNSQGWFNYNLIDGQIVLGLLETFDTSVTAYDFFLWGGDIAAYGTDIYTVDSANPRKFHSTNDRLLASLSSFFLDGGSFRELSLLIDEDGSGIFSLAYGVSKIYVTFADFGKATSPTLEAFIANPIDKASPSAWTEKQLALLSSNVMNDDKNKLPFPSFASFTFEAGWDSSTNTFDFIDGKPGENAAATYGAQLIQAGWTYNEADSHPAATEQEHDVRYYTLPVTGEDDHIYEIAISYYSAEAIKYDREMATVASQYPYGYFAGMVAYKRVAEKVTAVDGFNDLLKRLLDYEGQEFPEALQTDKAVSFTGEDLAYIIEGDDDYLALLKLKAAFKSEEDVYAYADATMEDLLSKGFEYDFDAMSFWWEDQENGPENFAATLGEDSAEDGCAMVSLYKDLNDEGTVWWEWEFSLTFDDSRSEEEGQWEILGAYRLCQVTEEDEEE